MDYTKTGDFIKQLRTEKQLTQKELSEIIGCTDKAVSRWETGKGLPDTALLMPLCEALGITVNELLLGEKLITQTKEDTSQQEAFNTEKIPEILKKSDEAIVNIIEENEIHARKMNKSSVVFGVICCIQVVLQYVLSGVLFTLFSNKNSVFEPTIFTLLAYGGTAFSAGLLKGKIKWIYPVFCALQLILPNTEYLSGKMALFLSATVFLGTLTATVIGHFVSVTVNKNKP